MTLSTSAGQQRQDISHTRQIPREEWGRFLTAFSEMHQETAVRLEVLSEDGQISDLILDEIPLLGISLDEEAGPPELIIDCGDTAGATPAATKYVICNPKAIWTFKPAGDYGDAIRIDTEHDGTLILTVNPHPGRGQLDLDNVGRSEVQPG